MALWWRETKIQTKITSITHCELFVASKSGTAAELVSCHISCCLSDPQHVHRSRYASTAVKRKEHEVTVYKKKSFQTLHF